MTIGVLDDLVPYPALQRVKGSVLVTLDAANEKYAMIFPAPRTGTIDRVCFRTGSVALGETVDVRVETVDAATGDPSGTLWATNTNAAQVIALTDDNIWFEVTLTAGASVTRGQIIAVVIALPGVTTANMTIAAALANGVYSGLVEEMTYGDLYTGTWAKQGDEGIGAVRYDDATYAHVHGMLPYGGGASSAAVAFNNTSTPDERGNRLILPFGARCAGIWATVTRASVTTALKLYDSADTLLESVTVDLDNLRLTGSVFALFDTSVILTAGDLYRITIAPDSATSVTNREIIVPSAALMNALPGGDAIYKTTRTDAGAWTDTETERVVMGLLLDGLDDGASRAGGIRVLGSAVAGSVI